MITLWCAAAGQTLFVAFWSTRPWRKYPVGWAMMTKSLSLCAILWFWILGAYLPDEVRDAVRQVLVAAVTIGIWAQLVVLVNEARREPAKTPAD